jgi:lipopolysaccharide transport system ATP-binding protein
MANLAIRVENLGKEYRIAKREAPYKTLQESLIRMATAPFRRRQEAESFWALNGLSFTVNHGEVVGIIGRNGAGKSTLLKILSQITEPTKGEVDLYGRVGALLEVGTGFHPELTGRENIYLNGAILGMHRVEIERKFDEIVDFAGVEQFIDTPVKHYSSGMGLRLGFAVAAHLEPEILVVDEVLAVGDLEFQKKCLGKMGDVAQSGRTVLFVSHNMAAIQSLCNRAILLSRGKIIADSDVNSVIDSYLDNSTLQEIIPLNERQDRQGTGALKMTDVYVNGRRNNLTMVTGQDNELIIEYEAEAPLKNVHISAGFYGLHGEAIAYLSNDLTQGEFLTLPAKGKLICRFEKLNLLPSRYSLNLFTKVNNVIADWVANAADVQVVEGDYFGTGKLPPRQYGAIIVPHQWHCEEA